MKRYLFMISLLCILSAGATESKTINLLSVGNSFSWCAATYLPKVVASVDGCKLVYEHASLSGCSLQRHWELVEKSEADPAFKPYKGRQDFSLKEKLQSRKWDVVTIQQASHECWDIKYYEPYARNLYDYIKKYAPQAEVVIQQTWAYRFDNPRLARWGFDQAGMYQRLDDAYRQTAQKLNCRVLPVGLAVQLLRDKQVPPFKSYDPAIIKDLKYPELPDQTGSIVVGYFWKKDEKGDWKLDLDSSHLGKRGLYLQACVWFTMLYNRPVTDIKFVPEEKDHVKDAAFLQEIAQEAVNIYQQVKR